MNSRRLSNPGHSPKRPDRSGGDPLPASSLTRTHDDATGSEVHQPARSAAQAPAGASAGLEPESASRRGEPRLAAAGVFPTAVYLNAAHELRAPLARMAEEVESLRETSRGTLNESQAAIARNLALSCRRMQRLVEECFSYGRMVSDAVPFTTQTVDARELFAELSAAWEPAYARKGVRLAVTPDPKVGVIRCDPHKLLRILSVLLENALKFTPSRGVVTLRWRSVPWRDGDSPSSAAPAAHSALRIEVRDTGCGVAPEDQQSIFQPFVRLDTEEKPLESGAKRGNSNYLRRRDDTAPGVGLGLGLAVASRLVEMHGGRIWVESEPPRGSTFVVLLPQVAAAQTASVD